MKTKICLVFIVLISLIWSGCNKDSTVEWEIVAENLNDKPVTISVNLDGENFHDARVIDLPKGKQWLLLSAKPKVIVLTAKAVYGKQEESVNPKVEVPAGKRFLIQFTADGKLKTSIVDK